jgi:hypothetical protein
VVPKWNPNPKRETNMPEPDPETSKKPETGDPPDPQALQAEVDKWKALARKNEQRAKENADAASKLTVLEDQQKSELQKLTEKAEQATRDAEAAQLKLLRLEVASAKGLTPLQAQRLQGGTRDEIESDADDLLAAFKPAEPTKPPAGDKPKARLQPAGEPEDEPEETDPRKLADRIQNPW